MLRLQHPVSLFFLSLAVSVFVLAFTLPTSIIRPACFPILLFNVWFMLNSGITVSNTHPFYANLLGGSIFTLAIRYFDIVMLRKSSYETGGPTTTPDGEQLTLVTQEGKQGKSSAREQVSVATNIFQRILFATSHLFDNRLSGTQWEVKNVPYFDKHNPSYIPSKTTYLRNNIVRAVICVILLDLAQPSADAAENARLFAPEKVPFFSRLQEVTIEDIAMRFVTTIATITITYLLFQAMYVSLGVASVGLGISAPEKWRPFFGDISDAWSLRRAWGIYWHQATSSWLTGPAKYVAFRLLRLPKHSKLARYVIAVIAFFLSGYMHVCGESAAGIPLSESGVIRFFTTQALGLFIEDSVRGIWNRVVVRDRKGARWWEKAVGFVWVVVWMAWSMPAWTYPASRRSQGEGVLPFSIVGYFKN